MLFALLVGFGFGFIGSIPIAGPIAILVFNCGLENRFRNGLYIALGASIAESIYAFMAFWGLSTMLSAHPLILPISRVVGAVILILLGLYFALRRHGQNDAKAHQERKEPRKRSSFLLGFSLTAVNPTLLVTWTAAITALHSTGLLRMDATDALPFSGGVCGGIVAWFAVLLALIQRFKSRMRHSTIDRLVRAMGVMLIFLGLWVGSRFLIH